MILAAGAGSRYGGAKQLEAIGPGGATLMEYSIYDAIRASVDRLIFVIRPGTDPGLLDRWSRRYSPHAEVKFAFQHDDVPSHGTPRSRPWGTVHALLSARTAVSGTFVVLNADDFYGRDALEAAFRFLSPLTGDTPQYAVLGYRLENTVSSTLGVNRALLRMDAGGRLRSIAEARQLRPGEAGNFIGLVSGSSREFSGDVLVSMNLWAFTPAIFPLLEQSFAEFVASNPGPEQELVLPEAIDSLLRADRIEVQVLPTRGIGFGLTHPDDRPQVSTMLRRLVEAGEYPQLLWDV
ncbi:MAG TPA: NTP transferase domain-containing protein [Gemmatimonadales bacterium]|nr:NTP transferase domain-containing protein [Gemmatimonadales bacterium]